MDYDKTNESLDNSISKTEEKIVNLFDSNLNFVRNLRKYITNEYKLFEEVVLKRAIYLGLILILFEVVMGVLGYKSILGMIPKLLAVLLILIYTNRKKLRRKT